MLKYDVILKLAQLIDGWIFKFLFERAKVILNILKLVYKGLTRLKLIDSRIDQFDYLNEICHVMKLNGECLELTMT